MRARSQEWKPTLFLRDHNTTTHPITTKGFPTTIYTHSLQTSKPSHHSPAVQALPASSTGHGSLIPSITSSNNPVPRSDNHPPGHSLKTLECVEQELDTVEVLASSNAGVHLVGFLVVVGCCWFRGVELVAASQGAAGYKNNCEPVGRAFVFFLKEEGEERERDPGEVPARIDRHRVKAKASYQPQAFEPKSPAPCTP